MATGRYLLRKVSKQSDSAAWHSKPQACSAGIKSIWPSSTTKKLGSEQRPVMTSASTPTRLPAKQKHCSPRNRLKAVQRATTSDDEFGRCGHRAATSGLKANTRGASGWVGSVDLPDARETGTWPVLFPQELPQPLGVDVWSLNASGGQINPQIVAMVSTW